ncbi:SixA phosphatase family protein [Modestobacter versicolor]|uniref:SixA phosphatase family protein n=1 Tax=Modestobacter versicolor TaxID=429133 RepID=UPI0034DE866A
MTVRRLLLVRHAQAADAASDVDRPLTAHGARRAVAIGGWLAQHDLTPDRAVVSPARRALQTWQLAGGVPPVVEPRVYDNTVEALLAVVHETPDDVQRLVLVGHNPSIGELAAILDDGAGDAAARREVAAGFPTGAVAVFDLDGPFADLVPGGARLHAVAVPGSD